MKFTPIQNNKYEGLARVETLHKSYKLKTPILC